jgi:hypothetical protein
MSPTVLIELLDTTGTEYNEVISRLDLFEKAIYSVAWAGQNESQNWFHIAREYTEKWHHQQQIREAVGKSGIMIREFFYPMIDTFMQALPYNYRSVKPVAGTTIRISINGELGGEWIIQFNGKEWEFRKSAGNYEAEISIEPDLGWKLFTTAVSEEDAEKQIIIHGNQELGRHILRMRSVMV